MFKKDFPLSTTGGDNFNNKSLWRKNLLKVSVTVSNHLLPPWLFGSPLLSAIMGVSEFLVFCIVFDSYEKTSVMAYQSSQRIGYIRLKFTSIPSSTAFVSSCRKKNKCNNKDRFYFILPLKLISFHLF